METSLSGIEAEGRAQYEEWLDAQAEHEQLDFLLVETQAAATVGDLIECGLLPVHPHRLPDLDLLDWDEWGCNLH